MRLPRPVRPAVFAAALLTAACAGTADYPSPEVPTTIVVDNTTSMVSSLTVHLVGTHGVRKRLGTVRLNEKKVFTVRFQEGRFRLIAEPTDGRELRSSEFVLATGDEVEWDVDRNNIWYHGRQAAAR